MSIYLLDKQEGITSNKALSLLKIELNVKKAGFSGVLDPFATGLLIVATNGDTKFLELFLKNKKTYSGTILFGKTTDTLDTDGEVIEVKEDIVIDEQQVKSIVENKFNGKIMQLPPNHSNIKVDGKRAHELTRKNIEFELKEVEREIYSFEINKVSELEYSFLVTVSSGTYIRSLARDIGKELSVPSMLTSLRRESIGDIKVNESLIEVNREDVVPLPFKEVEESLINDLLNGKLVEIESEYPEFVAKDNSRYLWVTRKDTNKYKIHKNIV